MIEVRGGGGSVLLGRGVAEGGSDLGTEHVGKGCCRERTGREGMLGNKRDGCNLYHDEESDTRAWWPRERRLVVIR